MSIKESKSSASLAESKKPDETQVIAEEEESKEANDNEMESSDDSYVKVFKKICLSVLNAINFRCFRWVEAQTI